MNFGYIYILQNKSFGNNVIKIGMTTRKPNIRAKEMYRGASGVPEPFDVTFACKVADCKLAEKKIHQVLNSYKSNKNREFFIISIEIAKSIILDISQEVNKIFNYPEEDLVIIDRQLTDNSHNYTSDPPDVVTLRIDQIISSPLGTSSLSNEQKVRVKIIAAIFRDVYPSTDKEWIQGFSRDHNPEKEIKKWENIGKAFLKIDHVEFFNEKQKIEAFSILLRRSMQSASKVLKEYESKVFSRKAAKKILSGYEAEPSPIVVIRRT